LATRRARDGRAIRRAAGQVNTGLGIRVFSGYYRDTQGMIRYFFTALLLAMVLATQAGQSTAAGQAQDKPWVEVALPDGLDLIATPDGRDGEKPYPELDAALAALATAAPQDRRATADASGLRLENGRVQVQVVIQPQNDAAAREAVAAAGGEVTGAMDGILQAWLPPD